MDKTKSNSSTGLILNIIAGVCIILSLIPAIPYRSYFTVIAMFTGLFTYHSNKKVIGIVLTLIAIILAIYFIISGFIGFFEVSSMF